MSLGISVGRLRIYVCLLPSSARVLPRVLPSQHAYAPCTPDRLQLQAAVSVAGGSQSTVCARACGGSGGGRAHKRALHGAPGGTCACVPYMSYVTCLAVVILDAWPGQLPLLPVSETTRNKLGSIPERRHYLGVHLSSTTARTPHRYVPQHTGIRVYVCM